MSSVKTGIVSVAFALWASSMAAHATIYNFGNLLSGSGPATADFATLSVTGTNTSTWIFNLTLDPSMASTFGNSSFVGAMAVNMTDPFNDSVLVSGVGGSGAGWTPAVTKANGGGPTGVWDFRFDFGKGSNKLNAGDTVSWTATFAKNGQPAIPDLGDPSFALHVQGITSGNNNWAKGDDSAWYIPNCGTGVSVPAVPEPETYALMGLGLVGLVAVARRKRSSTTSMRGFSGLNAAV